MSELVWAETRVRVGLGWDSCQVRSGLRLMSELVWAETHVRVGLD